MIKGTGIDLVEVERMAKRIEKPEFVNLIFTRAEQEYCRSKKHLAQHFAARFAAKEAYMKAVGWGWTNDAHFTEIEVINNKNGKPNMVLSGQTLAYFRSQEFTAIQVSLSHTNSMATAIVIIE